MCGILGYVGERQDNLATFFLEGLERLEYRGYDSAGFAVLDHYRHADGPRNGLPLFKEVGPVDQLTAKVGGSQLPGGIGIGHTRWATHGGVTVANAHPHLDCTGSIVVVHNGIIENYQPLKQRLLDQGHRFTSDTDTEVVAHLVEAELASANGHRTPATPLGTAVGRNGTVKAPVLDPLRGYSPNDFAAAVFRAFRQLHGLNAIVVGSTEAQSLALFRLGSPLAVGLNGVAALVSSDLPALSAYTDRVLLLDDGEGALLTLDQPPVRLDARSDTLKQQHFSTRRNGHLGPSPQSGTPWTHSAHTTPPPVADKGAYPHFMLKEIHEQAEVLARIAAYPAAPISTAAAMIERAFGTYFTACGTASYAALEATYLFSHLARKHVNFAVGSEFYFLEDFLVPESLLVAASQSGETMDTIEAVRAAKRHDSQVMALVNVPGSSLTRLADYALDLYAGPEKAVVSTKAYTAKLGVFLLLAYTVAGDQAQGRATLQQASVALSDLFSNGLDKQLRRLAGELAAHEHLFTIGRDVNYPTALEAALKIKETSYIHAEGFAGGELKHGVIALIEDGTPCIVFAAKDRSRAAVLSNAIEMRSRGATIIGIGPEREDVFDEYVHVPDVGYASPIVSVVPAQLLAYHLAIERGLNPDKPRNLAKSVTVK